jgi:hypothetical protein
MNKGSAWAKQVMQLLPDGCDYAHDDFTNPSRADLADVVL